MSQKTKFFYVKLVFYLPFLFYRSVNYSLCLFFWTREIKTGFLCIVLAVLELTL